MRPSQRESSKNVSIDSPFKVGIRALAIINYLFLYLRLVTDIAVPISDSSMVKRLGFGYKRVIHSAIYEILIHLSTKETTL